MRVVIHVLAPVRDERFPEDVRSERLAEKVIDPARGVPAPMARLVHHALEAAVSAAAHHEQRNVHTREHRHRPARRQQQPQREAGHDLGVIAERETKRRSQRWLAIGARRVRCVDTLETAHVPLDSFQVIA